MYAVCSCVVGWVVVVVMAVVRRVGDLSLLLTKSLSVDSLFEPGRVSREIVVVSVGSGWL